MRRLLTFIVMFALLAAACGSPAPEIQSDDVVAEVLGVVDAAETSATKTTVAQLEVPPGCELVTELDEYGFEVQVVNCDDRQPLPEDPDWLGSDSSKLAARMLREAMIGQE